MYIVYASMLVLICCVGLFGTGSIEMCLCYSGIAQAQRETNHLHIKN